MYACFAAFSGGCVVMSAGNPLGRWAVKNCTLFKAGNLCKKPIQSVVQPTPEPVVPDLSVSCAPGWVSQEHFPYCYKVCLFATSQGAVDLILLDNVRTLPFRRNVDMFFGFVGLSWGACVPKALMGGGRAIL